MLNCGYLLPDVVIAQLAYGATILSFLGKDIIYKKSIKKKLKA